MVTSGNPRRLNNLGYRDVFQCRLKEMYPHSINQNLIYYVFYTLHSACLYILPLYLACWNVITKGRAVWSFPFGFRGQQLWKCPKKIRQTFLLFPVLFCFLSLIPRPINVSCSLLWTRISGPAYKSISRFDSKSKHAIGNLMAKVTFSTSIIVLCGLCEMLSLVTAF